MKFIMQKSQKTSDFSLVYRKDEYAFDIEPCNQSGFTSVLINDLQLEIDDEGKILYVWGYCPLIKFDETYEEPRDFESSDLFVQLDKDPVPGISQRLNDFKWPVYMNRKSKWICLGNPDLTEKEMVSFAPDCVAVLKGQQLTALWLHPRWV